VHEHIWRGREEGFHAWYWHRMTYEEHVEKGGVEENRKGPNFLSLHKHESIIIYLQTRRGTAMAIFPTSSSVCIIFLIRTCQIIPR